MKNACYLDDFRRAAPQGRTAVARRRAKAKGADAPARRLREQQPGSGVTQLLTRARHELGLARLVGECLLVPAALAVALALAAVIAAGA